MPPQYAPIVLYVSSPYESRSVYVYFIDLFTCFLFMHVCVYVKVRMHMTYEYYVCMYALCENTNRMNQGFCVYES